jgi:hypothetical protein
LGSLSQAFTTTDGQLYNVSFWAFGNANLSFSWVSPSEESKIHQFNINTLTWQLFNYVFTADAATAGLYFFNPSTTVNVDSFNVSAVPVPAAAWLLATGLIGIVGLKRKFQR